MCQRNWRKYNPSLVQRGSLTFFADPNWIRSLRNASKIQGKTGRPGFHPHLILYLLLMKLTYNLSYRACEGLGRSVLRQFKIPVPSYSTICRRMRQLQDQLPKLSSRRPRIALIDASGFKVHGEGEWKVKVHGKSKRRLWVKVHLVVDNSSGEVVDLLVTSNTVSDINAGSQLLRRISGSVQEIYADGAYDGRRFRRLAYSRQIEPTIPPPKNAKLDKAKYMESRNDALRLIHGLGGDKIARTLWSKLTGYCHRVKVESAFSRLKRLFGDRLFSRRFDAIAVEAWIKAFLSNLWLKSAV